MSGHVSHKSIPEFSTKSLGHGLPVACGTRWIKNRQQRKQSSLFIE